MNLPVKKTLRQKTSWLYNHFISFYKLIGIVWHLKKKFELRFVISRHSTIQELQI